MMACDVGRAGALWQGMQEGGRKASGRPRRARHGIAVARMIGRAAGARWRAAGARWRAVGARWRAAGARWRAVRAAGARWRAVACRGRAWRVR